MWDPTGQFYNYDQVKAGDTISLALTIVLYAGENVSNVRAWVLDQELYIDGVPPEGMAAGVYYTALGNFTIREEDILARFESLVPTTISYDDIDGIGHTLNGEIPIKIELRPTEYALYFHFFDQNYVNVSPTFTADIIPPFSAALSVSEDVTITKSGRYQILIRDLQSGFSIIEGEQRYVEIPANTVGEGETLSIQLMDEAPLPPVYGGDDFVDIALTHTKPGEKLSWS
jgi:hypothetical protein